MKGHHPRLGAYSISECYDRGLPATPKSETPTGSSDLLNPLSAHPDQL